MPIDVNSEAQIERDLFRTFPRHPLFASRVEHDGTPDEISIEGKGIQKLKRVLIAFANYEIHVDYVQGMNFIVGSLLLHASETMAFWLFVTLIEDCALRDIFTPKLPGLYKHSQIIDRLISIHMPELYEHFYVNNIRAELFCSEWIFGLFSSVIPLENMTEFYSAFFQNGWVFFYQLVL